MNNWLTKILTDISNQHKISDDKANLLFNKLLAMIFYNGESKEKNTGREKRNGTK